MGLKSVEMQVAITRSQDASKMQDQMSRQGQQFQETLTKQQLREDVLKRSQVNEHEKVQKKADKEESQQQGSDQERDEKQKEAEQKKQSMTHPYLGTRIDLSR